jgi:DMSO/TMAO reductase YedYZ molybdopterin-dependent catalytic subunit
MNTKQIFTSRRTFITGLASAGGLLLTGCSKELPPTYGNVLRMGDVLTYKAQRLLLPTQSLAKEYDRREISSILAIGTTDPADPRQPAFNPTNGAIYERLRSDGFSDWGLSIEGRVARPGTYSLADLNFYAFDDIAEGIDMFDALHPQTILAYGMNGRDLPISHGAPLRLRVETQLGYKSTKYIRRIVVKDEFDDLGKLGDLQNGWSWYAGI